jgi:branched-chain amino acid transport system substrate-binding protein
MQAKRFMSLFLSCVLLVAVFAGCGKKAEDGDIVIGVMLPTSGDEAAYGTEIYRCYQLAAEEINAAGGILGRQIKLFQADDGCNSGMATTAAARIISQDVDFVIGGYCSGATIPAMQQYYDEDLIFLISAANSTRITELGLNQSFMLNSPGTHAAVTLGALLKSLGSQKVALIHQGDDYTQNLSDIMTAELPGLGFEIVTTQVMEKDQPDVSAIVTAIRNSGADFVYWCGYHADGAKVIRQLDQGGFEGHIAVGDGSASTELIVASGPSGEGVYVTCSPFAQFTPGGEGFIANFKTKFGEEPGTAYATLAYDTLFLLKDAVEKAEGFEFAKVRDTIQRIEYKGLSGLIKFTADRELAESNFIVLQIENGEFVMVTP